MAGPLTVEDLLLFALPTEVALAPDGRRLIVTVLSQDADEDKRFSHLWLIDLASADPAPRQLTFGKQRDRQPAWSPDGTRVAFASDRDQGSQVWLLPMEGGEARKVTAMRRGASQPRWSPDGASLLFTAEVREGENPLQDESQDMKKSERAEATRLRHITRLQYRWDGGDILEGRGHLWLVSPDDAAAAPRQLTTGDFDHEDAAWSPDCAHIAFTSDRAGNRDANRTNAVYALALTSGEVERVSDGDSLTARPAWSPDGRLLAWYDMRDEPGTSISNTRVLVAVRTDGGWSPPRDLLGERDMSVAESIASDLVPMTRGGPTWDASGEHVWFPVIARGTVNLWRASLAGEAPVPVTEGDQQIGSFALAPDGRHLYTITLTAQRAPELAQLCLDSFPVTEPERWITDLNPWLRERAIVTPREFTYSAPDGWQMQGWVLLPLDASAPESAGMRWPVILQIHGGPHGHYGPSFYALMQNFAAAGYAVVYINPRGSYGYGETFARACDRDWGGADYRDVMAGLDAALARFPLDPDRLAVTGTSYGGYMTSWIVGHETRFKAAVTINSVSNLISSFGTSDVDAVFGLPEQGGDPWQRRDFYLERSPITYMPAVTTPTRVIGAERDWRCPIEQSEQVFTALKYLGRVETDFVRVPGTSHGINTGTPHQRVAQRRAILEWIERFVPPGPR